MDPSWVMSLKKNPGNFIAMKSCFQWDEGLILVGNLACFLSRIFQVQKVWTPTLPFPVMGGPNGIVFTCFYQHFVCFS
jgi:hypothetical protein